MNVVLDENARMPLKAHKWDAGYDLYSKDDYIIMGGCVGIVDTGVHVEIPCGYYGKIADRSSVFSQGVSTSGTIDSGYTGSIKVILVNHSVSEFVIHKGDRIAQLIFSPCVYYEMEQVDSLVETERGNKGFGSTGK